MPVTIRMVALTTLLTLLVAPAVSAAAASGCSVLEGARDRVECEARAAAREEARAEVERRIGDGAPGTSGQDDRSSDWQAAVEEANGFDAGAVLEPRPLAALGGLAWFVVALRMRRRRSRAGA